MTTKKAIAKKESTEISNVIDYSQFAGLGMEEATADDYAIPFIVTLQKLSPQLDETNGEFTEEAKAGMLFNTVTRKLYEAREEGLMVIPVMFRKEIIEWVPRDQGGGLVQVHPGTSDVLEQAERNDKGRFVLANGHELVDTAKHFVLALDPDSGEWFQAVVSMTSTQLKKSRRWNSVISTKKVERPDGTKVPAPSFAYTYMIKTIPESNDMGSWFGLSIEEGAKIQDAALFQEAFSFYKAIKSGDVKVQEIQPEGPVDTPF